MCYRSYSRTQHYIRAVKSIGPVTTEHRISSHSAFTHYKLHAIEPCSTSDIKFSSSQNHSLSSIRSLDYIHIHPPWPKRWPKEHLMHQSPLCQKENACFRSCNATPLPNVSSSMHMLLSPNTRHSPSLPVHHLNANHEPEHPRDSHVLATLFRASCALLAVCSRVSISPVVSHMDRKLPPSWRTRSYGSPYSMTAPLSSTSTLS